MKQQRNIVILSLISLPLLWPLKVFSKKSILKITKYLKKVFWKYKIKYTDKSILKIQNKIVFCIFKIKYYFENSILHITATNTSLTSCCHWQRQCFFMCSTKRKQGNCTTRIHSVWDCTISTVLANKLFSKASYCKLCFSKNYYLLFAYIGIKKRKLQKLQGKIS